MLPAYWVRGDDVTVSPSGNPIFQLKFISLDRHLVGKNSYDLLRNYQLRIDYLLLNSGLLPGLCPFITC